MTTGAGATCPRCGAPRRAGEWAQLCPGCLLTSALALDDLACPYQVLAPIAEAATSTTYLAHALSGTRGYVELEIFDASVVARDVLSRHAHWRRRLHGFRHPGIVSLRGAGVTSTGQLYLASDYVPGLRLADALATVRTLPSADRVHLAWQLVTALAAAHAAGLFHMNLTPAHVRITSSADARSVIVGVGRALLLERGDPAAESDLVGIDHILRALDVEVVPQHHGTMQSIADALAARAAGG